MMPLPPPSNSCKIIHFKMTDLRMVPQRMDDFYPIYFFMLLKSGLIDLHILLTKQKTPIQKATMVETAGKQHKSVKS